MPAFPFALPPKQSNNLIYTGYGLSTTPAVEFPRAPKSSDINYPLFTLWRNSDTDAVFPDQLGDMWYLAYAFFSGGTQLAHWNKLSTGAAGGILNIPVPFGTSPVVPDGGGAVSFTSTGGTVTITGGLHTINFDTSPSATSIDKVAVDASTPPGTNPVLSSANQITLEGGATFTTGTRANPIRTNSLAANTIDIQIQLAGSNAGSSTANNFGVAQFDANQFNVVSGFVQLVGGTTAPILGVHPDAHTGPGTDPVIPDVSGNIKIEGGATFATGTQANPIRTNSLAANTIDLQVQLAGSHAATSTANDFGVAQFDANQFTVTSGYVQIIGGGTTGAVTTLEGDDSAAVVPTAGVINLTGVTVANATHAKPVFFVKNGTSIEELDVQLTTTSTSGAKNINKSGLAHFDSASFTVDAVTGFVSLAAGGTDVQTLTGNTGGAISPVAGNINTVGTGSITIAGAGNTLTTQLTGLIAHNVLLGEGTATIGLVAPSATSGVPLISQGSSSDPVFGTAVVAGGGTGDTSFTAYAVITGGITSTGNLQNVSGVGTSGQVLTSNGAGALPTWQTAGANALQITMDAGTSPISPTADALVFTGAQVATGVVGTNVIRTDGSAANAMTIQIQRTTVSAVSNVTLNGVCHFDSSKFSVDANGFVTFTGSTSNIPWTDEGGNFNAASNNGYFCTALLTANLPPTPAQGDVIKFVADTSSVVTVKANTGQFIRMGNVISASAGTAATTKQGDSAEFVYRAASATWYAVAGFTGSWTVT